MGTMHGWSRLAAASTDFLQQFVVPKVDRHLHPTRGGAIVRRLVHATGVTDSAYSFVHERAETCLQNASRAKSFRCVSEDFLPAVLTNPGCDLHPISIFFCPLNTQKRRKIFQFMIFVSF